MPWLEQCVRGQYNAQSENEAFVMGILPKKNALERKFSSKGYYVYVGVMVPLGIAVLCYCVYSMRSNTGLALMLNDFQASFTSGQVYYPKFTFMTMVVVGILLSSAFSASIAFLFDLVTGQGQFGVDE